MTSRRTILFTVALVLLTFAAATGTYAAEQDEKPKLTISFYGYLKLDASFDDSRVSIGNYARWVENESVNVDDGEFNMTARQSRFGMWATRDVEDGIVARGRFELDFYGSGAENKPEPFMRHAYLEMIWKDYDFSLIAGQTSDVISPLVPSTVNYTVAWWAGNIGYRRPQLRLTKGFGMGGDTRMVLEGAIARNIGHDTMYDPGDTGEDSSLPIFQGRAAFEFKMPGGKGGIGFSGHVGTEEVDLDASGETYEELDTWSINVDVKLPIVKGIMVQGEFYNGANMDAYLGGIGQGVNLALLEEIKSKGGWVAATFGPFEDLTFNAGYSMDDPDDDFLADGARSKNSAFWGNVFYKMLSSVTMGVEVSKWETEYIGRETGDAVRVQGTMIYSF